MVLAVAARPQKPVSSWLLSMRRDGAATRRQVLAAVIIINADDRALGQHHRLCLYSHQARGASTIPPPTIEHPSAEEVAERN